ncbi:Lcl C-terminal domain-containing protein [Microbulbifer sp. TRSA007]|uniref:Lcl C-terminal domain-containing protein n=1 Tax=Microbulbifer sp. TRSA007 TaxID=3243384 RepID=UPI004039D060
MFVRIFWVFIFPAITVCAVILHQPSQPLPSEYHLVKIDKNGEPIEAWAGPWSCICDTDTGLLWEVKTDDEGIHDGRWTYSWYQYEEGIENNGDCYFEEERCDTEDLIRNTNQQKLCATQNWRLPDITELRSIILQESKSGRPLIATEYFPKTQRGDYWTRNFDRPLYGIYQYLKTGAGAVNFMNAETITIPYRNAAFVRLVSNHSTACNNNPE